MILNRLHSELERLSKSERRLAEVILADPQAVITASTAELARRASVSDPTVSRLCKSLGISGFPDFKVQLAQDLARNPSQVNPVISDGDDTRTCIDKLINANQAALEHLRNALQSDQVDMAVEALNRATRIEIFGMGASAAIAQDAQHKLFRLGTPACAYEDNLKQRMVAAAADSDSLILFISFTGETRATLEVARIARESGAFVLGITAPGSPLAQLCDITLTSGNALEDTTVYIPMATRIVILSVIDLLCTRLALRRQPQINDTLQKIKRSLHATRVRDSS